MGSVFKFLVILLGIGWLLGQLIRFFLRTKLAKFAKEVNQAAKDGHRAETHTKADGSVHVDHIPPKHQKKRQKDIEGGEYVDYEEVKD